MAESNCTFENIFSDDLSKYDKCDIAKYGCGDLSDFINFFQVFLCAFNGSLWAMIPFCILVLFLIL